MTEASNQTQSEPPGPMPGPLQRVRVLDFGWVLAGAIPGMVLADMGAQVIKVETRQRLDYMRQGRPLIGDERDPELNPMFHNVNRSKLSITLNTTKPEAVDLARKVRTAMADFSGTMGTTAVSSVKFESWNDIFDDVPEVYRRLVDFIIAHR